MKMIRGNKIVTVQKPLGDRTWTETDWESAKTVDARWIASGVLEEERSQLLPCKIWKTKLPGLQYPDLIESRLQQLQPEKS